MVEPRGVRIGELLVEQGVLSEMQVAEILDEQKSSGRPFGDIAERMFDVTPDAIEQAWVQQYITLGTEVDLESQEFDIEVLRLINRRQAWQFRMLPIGRKGGELVAATCHARLPRAVNFAWHSLNEPVYFLIAQRPQLESFLMTHYPFPGVLELPLAV